MALVSCGEALIDIIKLTNSSETSSEKNSGDDDIFKFVQGGGPYNSAIAASKLGLPTYFLGEIADDWLGDKLLSKLTSANVKNDLIRLRNLATPIAIVNEGKNNVSYIFHGFSENEPIISQDNIPVRLDRDINYFLFGGLASTLKPSSSVILSWLKNQTNIGRYEINNAPIIYFDPNIRGIMIKDKDAFIQRFKEFLNYVDIIKLSDDDFFFLYDNQNVDEVFSSFISQGVKYLIFSKGKYGASLYFDGGVINEPAPKVDLQDTVGAGDCFNAAFLFSLYRANIKLKSDLLNIQKSSLHSYLNFACNAAALSCTKQGANPPYLTEVENFIKTQS